VAGFGPAIEGSNPSAPVLAFMRVCGVSRCAGFGGQGVRALKLGAFGPEDPCGFAAMAAGKRERVPRSCDRAARSKPSADAGVRAFERERRFFRVPRSINLRVDRVAYTPFCPRQGSPIAETERADEWLRIYSGRRSGA
jgi:hypothetical protein